MSLPKNKNTLNHSRPTSIEQLNQKIDQHLQEISNLQQRIASEERKLFCCFEQIKR